MKEDLMGCEFTFLQGREMGQGNCIYGRSSEHAHRIIRDIQRKWWEGRALRKVPALLRGSWCALHNDA